MSQAQARCLYDFESQHPGELATKAGEILTIMRQDIGEGWWEAKNTRGQLGLIPESYIEMIINCPPVIPPPPLPSIYSNLDELNGLNLNGSVQKQQSFKEPFTNNANAFNQQQPLQLQQDWDSDWDDDDEYSLPASQYDTTTNRTKCQNPAAAGTLKKNFNRFSLFVKTGVETYILGQLKPHDFNSKWSIEIIQLNSETYSYLPLAPDKIYTCTLSSPQKESKLKGLKSYIAYQMTCSNTGIRISRRYKHFDWLHDRLEEKFTLIAIPPLPGKQVTGRYEEEFIEHRMNQLQMWVNRICRHPVLSQCDVWSHFVTCTDMKQQWKEGKRKAEKDALLGANIFTSIKAPQQSSFDLEGVEQQLLKYAKFIKKMDITVATLYNHFGELWKKVLSPSTNFFNFVLGQFCNLAKAFEQDDRRELSPLLDGIKTMYDSSSIQWDTYFTKHKGNMNLIQDMLFEYRGMLSQFPGILNIHKSALNKVKECQRLSEEGKISANEMEATQRRMDVITYATFAEIDYFRRECINDFKVIIKMILQTMLNALREITQHVADAIAIFEKL